MGKVRGPNALRGQLTAHCTGRWRPTDASSRRLAKHNAPRSPQKRAVGVLLPCGGPTPIEALDESMSRKELPERPMIMSTEAVYPASGVGTCLRRSCWASCKVARAGVARAPVQSPFARTIPALLALITTAKHLLR